MFHDSIAKFFFESYIISIMPETPETKVELDPVEHVENLYFELQRNLSVEAKNIIWHCLVTAKQFYPQTFYKEEWTSMLNALEDVINDFENQLSERAELKLSALEKNLEELKRKEAIK